VIARCIGAPADGAAPVEPDRQQRDDHDRHDPDDRGLRPGKIGPREVSRPENVHLVVAVRTLDRVVPDRAEAERAFLHGAIIFRPRLVVSGAKTLSRL